MTATKPLKPPFDPMRAVASALEPMRRLVQRWPREYSLQPLIYELDALLAWLRRRQDR